MFADKGFVSHLGRTAMIAGVAATVLTSVGPSAAVAAPATKEKGLMAAGTSGATDFSAQRRYYRGGYYRGGGAAAAAAFAGIVGTGIAIAAANARRDAYYDSYGYYGGPGTTLTTMVAAPTTAATGPECPIIGVIRSPAGNQNSQKRPAGRLWPAGNFAFDAAC
jgi:hypothetical protein